MYCIVIHVISESRWFVWEVLIQYYVYCVERRKISERAGKQFASTRAKTAFVGAGVSVEFCFTLRVRSMNSFCLTGFIVALAIRELLSASAVKVFTTGVPNLFWPKIYFSSSQPPEIYQPSVNIANLPFHSFCTRRLLNNNQYYLPPTQGENGRS